MAAKKAAGKTTVAPEGRRVLKVELRAGESRDEQFARLTLRPEVQAGYLIQTFSGDSLDVTATVEVLAAQVAAVNGGDLRRPEALLITQAHTLNELFHSLARRSHSNMGGGYLDAADRYMRLALKAQSQCRATLETLAAIKNPPVVYARQANLAMGAQQVNNGVTAPSQAREIENTQTQLLRADDGSRLDIGTAGAAIGSDPALATVGEIDRAEVSRG